MYTTENTEHNVTTAKVHLSFCFCKTKDAQESFLQKIVFTGVRPSQLSVFICNTRETYQEMDTLKLLKYLGCNISRKEEEEVRKWIADDPDGSHLKQYREAHMIFDGMTLYDETRSEGYSYNGKRKTVKAIIAFTMGVAAAAILAFGAASFGKKAAVDEISSRIASMTVPSGKSMEFCLEDGTKVWLNSGSTIEYPPIFGERERKVRLVCGEALFDVVSQDDRPFVVETFASDIKVTGTRFDVRCYPEDDFFAASLIRGEIRVGGKKITDREYVLSPFDEITIKGDTRQIGKFGDPNDIECWTEGLINISRVPFDELMDKFELAFGISIIIERENLPEIPFTRGKVRISEGIDHALEMLKLGSDFTYEKSPDGNVIIIR